ncbi:J domain-containing protein [Pseudoduganella sp. SL102]|uniref:Molecular chaperone DnaJ n=1 Tax=Pseudoduganella albidiflava TaxID=321983 RepID=A0A411X586_9BURK|nr:MULTISPECIES: J domain-containing protein [Pseudoduganella]QBI04074.1 molecular chaperone DnaJ [Pseudoduganella albidiflava]WBS03363.1 J domain-containing protein [Pseudoduganella sp. SL102]GGY24479.1 molecular chaperone DnaJ [Pseudoduganella albidiflava]
MGKIHTHYDNLKVARGAPPEVVRAAYKALSQKYHPDKNPGDERAARIMAIVNTAYGTLADPQRRREHDEWIAQEEYEIELVDSTRQDDPHRVADAPVGAWSDGVQPVRRRQRLLTSWRWWLTAVSCLGAGWLGGVLTVAEPRQVSSVVAAAWGAKPAGEVTAKATTYPRAAQGQVASDGWETAPRPYSPDSDMQPPPIKVVALSQVILPGYAGDCENETPALVAPNGEPWPTKSGYVEGFPQMSKGQDMQLTLDNSDNAFPVFIRVFDLERRSNVRYVFVQAQDRFVVDQLATGRYEIRYQNIDLAGTNSCARR